MNTLDLSRALIQQQSHQQDKTAVFNFLKETLEKNDLHVEVFESKGVKNLVASTKGRKENTKKLIFNGHYDTVPPSSAWTCDPFAAKIEKDTLYGLGAVDMKCNLAAMLSVAIASKNLRGEVIIVAVGDEELGGANGTKHTIEKQVTADYAVIGEPTGMRLAVGHKSLVQLQVSATGKAAHAAFPTNGSNAIMTLVPALAKLHEQFRVTSKEYDEKLFSVPTLNVGMIQGGSAINVVPDQCSATLDFRLPPKTNRDKFISDLKAEYNELNFEIISNDNGWDEPITSKLVTTASQILNHNGYDTKPMYKLGASDARYYAKAGISTINVGAGEMKELHAPDEKISIKQLEQCEKFYKTLTQQLLT